LGALREKRGYERGSTRSHLWWTRFGRGCGPVVKQAAARTMVAFHKSGNKLQTVNWYKCSCGCWRSVLHFWSTAYVKYSTQLNWLHVGDTATFENRVGLCYRPVADGTRI
jgi:hypothetical protein